MKFSDIIILAKAGYKPSDVKELLELCETDPETKKKEINPEETEKPKEKHEESKATDAFEELVKQNGGI
nr:MAG TPA: hypothetical protein [Caudoviricetes sp.]